MSEKPEGDDKDPAPLKHSDAERVSGDEAESTPAGTDSEPGDNEDD